MTDNLQLAVNHAMQLAVNSQNDAVARSRMSLMYGMGMDDKRRCSAWTEYGWKEQINFSDLYWAYRRGGLAFAAVNKLVGKCWHDYPVIIEGEEQDKAEKETGWEKAIRSVVNTKFWLAFSDADRRRLVGRYAGILLHVKDSKKWHEPVDKGRAIEKYTVAWANCIKPKSYETDINSENYGEVTMWDYVATAPNGAKKTFDVHPDRVFILGDFSLDAIGFLEPGYNALTNIEKVEGGSGESFLKNAARQLNLNFEKEVDLTNVAAMYGVSVAELREKFDDVAVEMNRGNDVLMATQGASVTPLVTNVPNPTYTYDINLQTFSASVDVPGRILVGNQQAERSSTEDNKYMNSRCQSRRTIDITPEIKGFVEKLIYLGIIKPISEFSVIWNDLTEMTVGEKLDNAKKLSDINEDSLGTGEPLFDDNEIRNVAGFESREDVSPLPDEVPDEEVEES
ncbi:TPA: anti-CBASS protein Acb1 family protein [Vibrio parahaemolyticus]